jgi:hypothetical protein
MPGQSTAELTREIPFPDELGEPVWQQRRSFPVSTLYGVPAGFALVGAIAVRSLALHVVLGAVAVIAVWLLVRARRRALIETYTVTERFVAVVQPGGGRVAIETERLTGVTIAGDKVRLESHDGVLVLGFVRRQRSLLRALERVAPGLGFQRDVTAYCPT